MDLRFFPNLQCKITVGGSISAGIPPDVERKYIFVNILCAKVKSALTNKKKFLKHISKGPL